MLQKTRGVVLDTTAYAETSLIVKVFTESFGLQSFIINGVRKSKARYAANLFQPLSLIEVVAYFKKPGGLHRVADVSASPQLQNIPYDTVKITMAIFLGEVLYRSIKEEEANPELFSFIDYAVQMLDIHTEIVSRFHLCFMLQLSKYLGFYPSGKYDNITPYFDLKEGIFQETKPMHPHYLDKYMSELFYKMAQISLEDVSDLKINSTERKVLLENIIAYYELHHTEGSRIRSYEILNDILS